MEKIRRNTIEVIRNFTVREEKIKLDGGKDINPNSSVALNTFVKPEVLNAHK